MREHETYRIIRKLGLGGTNLGRRPYTHHLEIIEWREKVRDWPGIGDELSHDTHRSYEEQYAEAVRLLQDNSYVTMPEVTDSCGPSYAGLRRYLLFYHKDLVKRCIRIYKKALRRQRKGEITDRSIVYAPSPGLVEKYAEVVHLYATALMSTTRITGKTGVSKKGFYGHLQRRRLDLVYRRKSISYEEGRLVNWFRVREYNPATKTKYTKAIRRLEESGLSAAQIVAKFGLQPKAFRSYLREHKPELHARKGMARTDMGGAVSRHSMGKYSETMHLYGTTTKSVKSLTRRLGFNNRSFGRFIRRNFPEPVERHSEIVQKKGKQNR